MEKLKQFLDWFQNGNAMPYMEWYRIYPKGEVSQKDQDVFMKWLDDNNIGISPQPRIESIMLANKTTLEFLSTSDIKKIVPDWYKAEKEPKKEINVNTLTCNRFDKNFGDMIGWLDTKGNFHETDWGEHESFAGEYVRADVNIKARYMIFKKETVSNYSRDFLVSELNWVLLDCPANNGYLSIAYNKLTKAQKIFLEKYLYTICDFDTANKII